MITYRFRTNTTVDLLKPRLILVIGDKTGFLIVRVTAKDTISFTNVNYKYFYNCRY